MGDRRTFIKLLSFGLLILLVVGCGQDLAAPSETPDRETRIAAIPPTPTATSIPTHTPVPTPKGTPTQTPDPRYLEGTGNSLFPIPNQLPYFHIDAPTAIPTPSLSVGNLKLTDWSEEDALRLVQIADQYAYEAGVARASASSSYPAMMPLVSITIREMLSRFPDSEYSDEINWKLATSDLLARTHSESAREWIRTELENALNSTETSIENLEEFLAPKGLGVMIQPVENMKGNGQIGYFLTVIPGYDEIDRDLIVLVATEENGLFRVSYVETNLGMFHRGMVPNNYLRDQDEDGIPEIIFKEEWNLRILEWENGQFFDHSQGKMQYKLADTKWSEYYEFDPESRPEIDLITPHRWYGRTTLLWKWENGQYQIVEVTNPNPFGDFLHLGNPNENADYDEKIEVLGNIVQDWEEIEITDWWAKEYVDKSDKELWRLYLGFSYLYQDKERGIETIQAVVNSDADDITKLMGQTFLNHYSGETTQLVQACLAVDLAVDRYIASGEVSEEDEWKYSTKYPGYFCDRQIVLDYLLADYSQEPLLFFINALSKSLGFQHRRMEVDEIPVEIIDYAGINILVQINGVTQLIEDPGFFFDDLDKVIISPVDYLDNIDSVYEFEDEEDFYIIQFNLLLEKPSAQVLVHIYLDEDQSFFTGRGIKGQFILSEMTSYDNTYELAGDGDPCDGWDDVLFQDYLWDSEDQEFKETSYIEYLIFTAGKFDLAIETLQSYLKVVSPYFQSLLHRREECNWRDYSGESAYEYPRFLYLLGLAYELNGDTQLAVDTYYQLWQEAPESGYALLAREKLVEVP